MNPWSGAIWEHEHGPRGGDELNIPQPGKNYGWPLATYGINYSGQPIPEARGTGARHRTAAALLAGFARPQRHGVL